MPPRDQIGSDPRDILRLLRRRGWILLVCVIAIPVATYYYSKRLPKTYEATVTVQPGATAADSSLVGGTDFSGVIQNIAAVAALVQTRQVGERAAKVLGRPVAGDVSGSSDLNTGFISITVRSSDAHLAADSANAYASALGFTRETRAKEKVDAAIGILRQNVANEPDPVQRRQLSEQLQKLRAMRSAQGQNVQLIDAAQVPRSPISPNPGRNARLALIVALLIGAGLMVLVERWDRRLRKPEDVQDLTEAPLLAVIPRAAFPGGRPGPEIAESFQTLRDSLTYFNVARELSSLMVVSPLKGEGKTTVAINLAVSLARAGRNVILVDADLRNPRVAERMGIEAQPGLTNVLLEMPLADALKTPAAFNGRLRVLPAGPVPPNPSELLGSRRMSSLLDELNRQADVIVIDTAPLLAVSDTFPLLDQVSGVVPLVRLHETPRPAFFRMLEVIAQADGVAIGIVATGMSRTDSYSYGYGYGHGYGYGRKPSPSEGPPVTAPANGRPRQAGSVEPEQLHVEH